MLYVFLYIVYIFIFGFVTKTINENKGYEGGFWWGFWLGILGVIVVACKPDNRSYSQTEYEPMYPQAIQPESTWRCSSCGAENSGKLNYCLRCRSDRNEVQAIKVTCPHCGALNNNTNSVCFACHKPLSGNVEPNRSTASETRSIELIKQLAELHSQGILTDEEFSTKKAQLLEKMGQQDLPSDIQEDKPSKSKQLIDDSDWIDDGDNFVRCPTCNTRMSIDSIRARKKCPDCGRLYRV